MSENGPVEGAEELVGFGAVAGLVEAFDSSLGISAGVKTALCESSEETDKGQNDSLAASSSASDSEWSVGAACRTVWSGDGLVYPGKIISMEGEHCRVRFDVYENEEDVKLNELQRADTSLPTPAPQTQDWKPGSRCRAVYSGDGWVYPAVVLDVTGQRCRVRFDTYNNVEEQDVRHLLRPDALHTRTRRTEGSTSSTVVEEKQEDQGAERRPVGTEEQPGSSTVKEEEHSGEEEADQKRRATEEEQTKHNLPLNPPLPPPQILSPEDAISFLTPPPPPPPPFDLIGGAGEKDTTSNMLMLWYTCGFHTGCYMTRQMLKSNPKDSEHK